MDIYQLRTLVHVAELGSLSKAANRLRIAQPALSRQIRLLERELGARLFDRDGRGMIITEQGRSVLHHALRIMAELEEIRATVSDDNAPLRGHVSIGMPPYASDILSQSLVSAFRNAHPAATLRIISAYSGHLHDYLHRGEIDAAILYNSKLTQTLRTQPLLEEKLYLVGPAASKLAMNKPVEFAELESEILLLPSKGNSLRTTLDQYAEEVDILLSARVEADNYSTLKSLVREGHGLTVLPLTSIREEFNAGQLRPAPLVNPTPVSRLCIAFPTDRPVSLLARFAGQVIAAITQTIIQKEVWLDTNQEDEAKAGSQLHG